MINIVIPMAGRGSRFSQVGYKVPKPLIPVHGVPMIRLVIENLRPLTPHRFIFLALEEHIGEYNLGINLKEWAGDSALIIPVKNVTEGAACTVLLAEKYINNSEDLMIANSDQWVDFDVNNYLNRIKSESLDGLILTMTANDPKWSFVKIKDRLVTAVAEKVVISNEATVGIYNFKKGSEFVQFAKRMIDKELRVNNEFYVAPVYNELIGAGKKISYYNIGSELNGMYGLGTPDDLNKFIQLPVSRIAVSKLEK